MLNMYFMSFFMKHHEVIISHTSPNSVTSNILNFLIKICIDFFELLYRFGYIVF